MAFTMCAFVSMEDVRESDVVYSSSGMLKESRHELPGLRKQEINAVKHVLKGESSALTEVTQPSAVTLSLATCIIRC